MKKGKPQLSFTQVLDGLFQGDQIDIPLVYRLSDILPAELEQFSRRWPGIADDRRRELVQHMADISEENYEVDFSQVLGVCLEDKLPAVRKIALDGLWDTTRVGLVTPIIACMREDPEVGVQAAAARTLAHFILLSAWGQIARPVADRVVAALLSVYHNVSRAPAVRQAALEALGASDHPDVPDLIATAYETNQVEWQMSALYAMGNSADVRWLETVLGELESPDAETRAIAARAAGEIGRSEAIDPLLDLVYDEDADVQTAAIKALGQIGDEHALKILNRLAEDENLEPFYDLIDETLEEMDWRQGPLDLLNFDPGDEDERND